MALVGRRAPDFDLPITRSTDATRGRVTLDDYRDKWLILAFYPRDFSLVCPTELTALSARMDEFERRGCELLGISTDSIATHERWMATPTSQGGVGPLRFPLASDEGGVVSRAYGVYLEKQHIALRGLFIIDPNGVVSYETVHNPSVGRRSDEVLRILSALESGGMCPEDWCIDCAPIDATKALVPGSVLSHYRIVTKVGEGTFGAVYRADDTVLARTVALKVFQPGKISTTAVLSEARSAAALNHPNVCTIFAVDDSEGVPMIAMEYLDGRPLAAVLNKGPLSTERASRIGRQIASGMAAAHEIGIIHGDLKPANIMLLGDDVVKITDFGLARRARPQTDLDQTKDWRSPDEDILSGTPSYMSPEQSRGESITPASDVFSTAVVLYEMLSGRRAFGGDNILQVLNEVRHVDPVRIVQEFDQPFASLLSQALVPNPAERAITMSAIADALEAV